MPFCRECGKEVQEDWVTCPYCSEDFSPPITKPIGFQDSVVMGDITVNDPSTISDAISSVVQDANRCLKCNSSGITIFACEVCRNAAYCSVCKDKVFSERAEHFAEIEFHGLSYSDLFCETCFISNLERKYASCIRCEKKASAVNVKNIEGETWCLGCEKKVGEVECPACGYSSSAETCGTCGYAF